MPVILYTCPRGLVPGMPECNQPYGDPTAPCPKSQKADSCPPVIGSTIF
ncbi:unnamed protein product [Chondrus crispus]|uniref:Uncharacterized protein n=1 Tax=Chondrus crispus TaxID=2769 RepID=R7QHL1_CHOCR|nr:unnamed protein product [Chondrus crispus]CDF37977.1 unnamed protein product [Chondrus crispus]|eukprot:XP_005717846.1 unnamed protein product [Chondrus crispus]